MYEKLIINADDFGLTSGVNRGVITCHAAGIVTSTTLMVQGAAAPEAADLAAANPGLGVGLHLNLTAGSPVLPVDRVPSLVNSDGLFPGRLQAALWLTTGHARGVHLEKEITAQLERCRALGIEPTHVDSHHHIHAHPRLRTLLVRVCRKLGISRRRAYRRTAAAGAGGLLLASLELLPSHEPALKTPNGLFGVDTVGARDLVQDLELVLERGRGVLELMCHPGYSDETLKQVSSYSSGREDEMRSLLSAGLPRLLERHGIGLITYREL